MENISKKKLLCVLLAVTLLAAPLSSCLRKSAEPSREVGVGRDTSDTSTSNSSDTADSDENDESGAESTEKESESVDDEDSSETDTKDKESDVSGEVTWSFEDGKYTYSFPERPEVSAGEISAMNSEPKTLFEDDSNEDWYFGKTTYDQTTGEVTYVWDRYQSTLDAVDNYNGIYRGDQSKKAVYLTFDCGYEYGTTSSLLDILKEKNAPAAFFLTGDYVKSEDDLINRMLDEGHIIGNHTMNHKNMIHVTAEEFKEQLDSFSDLFAEKFPDAQPLRYFRPPEGAANEWVLKLADKLGYVTVMWSWAYYDYNTNDQPDPMATLEKAKTALHPGCVYLLHAESTTNVAILGDLIDWIRSQGYEILPICDIK